MDAPFVRCNGLTAILSQFQSLLLDQVLAQTTSLIHTRLLGPETGWSNWQGGFVASKDVDSETNVAPYSSMSHRIAVCRTAQPYVAPLRIDIFQSAVLARHHRAFQLFQRDIIVSLHIVVL